MNRYVFRGRVYVQDVLSEDDWTAETFAVSGAKALSNIKYQYKKQNNYNMRTPVDLRGRLTERR